MNDKTQGPSQKTDRKPINEEKGLPPVKQTRPMPPVKPPRQTDNEMAHELAEHYRVENRRLRDALKRVAYWFDTDPEIVEAMDERTRANHERQLRLIREALGKDND